MTRIVAEVKHVEVKANKNSGAYFYYYISNHHSTPEGLTKEAGYWPVSTWHPL